MRETERRRERVRERKSGRTRRGRKEGEGQGRQVTKCLSLTLAILSMTFNKSALTAAVSGLTLPSESIYLISYEKKTRGLDRERERERERESGSERQRMGEREIERE